MYQGAQNRSFVDRDTHMGEKCILFHGGQFRKKIKDIDLLQNLEIVLFCTARDNASFPLVLSSFDDASIVDSVSSPELDNTMCSFVSDENEINVEVKGFGKSSHNPIVKTMNCRINMADAMSNNRIVFCQGSKAFVDRTRKLCKSKKHVKFHYDEEYEIDYNHKVIVDNCCKL